MDGWYAESAPSSVIAIAIISDFLFFTIVIKAFHFVCKTP